MVWEHLKRWADSRRKRERRTAFTIEDLLRQFEVVRTLERDIELWNVPFLASIPEEALVKQDHNLVIFKQIARCMTAQERQDPAVLVSGYPTCGKEFWAAGLNESRIHALAEDAGCTEDDVKDLLDRYRIVNDWLEHLIRR